MSESQFRCVKKVPAGSAKFSRKSFEGTLGIHLVAHNRMPDRVEMHADLMRAAGLDLDLEQRESLEFFQHPIGCQRGSPAFPLGGHPRTNLGMPPDVEI